MQHYNFFKIPYDQNENDKGLTIYEKGHLENGAIGYMKGNMSKKEYIGYKNYVPRMPKANNEEEAIDEARKLYGNCEVILDWDDLGEVTFEIDEE